MDWNQFLDELARQGGLTARYAASGVGGLGAAFANPLAVTANKGLEWLDMDFRFPEQYELLQQALTDIGLPEPETTTEKWVGFGAELGVPDPTDSARVVSQLSHMIDPDLITQAMTVFHGTPHKWADDKPDMSKIGTGEGAQAYGHGLYFAEDANVAKMYQEQLRPLTEVLDLKVGGIPIYRGGQPVDYSPTQFTNNPRTRDFVRAKVQEDLLIDEWALRDAFDKGGIDAVKNLARENIEESLKYAADEWPESVAAYEQILRRMDADDANKVNFKRGESHLYELDLPDSTIDKMLDWDKPLSEQPESVRKALEESEIWGGLSKSVTGMPEWMPVEGGRMLYEDLVSTLRHRDGLRNSQEAQKAASDYLNSLGIPGIKYLDGTSRSAGEGTRNFVLFDDSLVTPLKRNGEEIAQALPMDEASRMARAREMGFDTDKVWYHGSNNLPADEFKTGVPSKRYTTFSERDVESQGVFFADNAEDAAEYGRDVGEYVLRSSKTLKPLDEIPVSSRDNKEYMRVLDDIEYILEPEMYDAALGGNPVKMIDVDGGISSVRVDDAGAWLESAVHGGFDWNYLDNPEVVRRIKERGYDSVTVFEPDGINSNQSIMVLDPKNIRSKHAKFDPDKIDSARLDASLIDALINAGMV